MQHMSVDLFTWNQKKFALLINWYSGYCFLKEFRTEPDSRDVINFLGGIFHEFGYPGKMRSDGGGQFHSEFEDFTKRAGIQWKPSSAYYAQSNGRVERSKTQRSGESFRDAWFSLQNTL